MANLNFFATRPDLEKMFEFVYRETDFRVFDSYSEFGQKLAEYPTFEALAHGYEIGEDRHGNGSTARLQLWSPSVMAKASIERVKLDPRRCDGFTFQYRITGPGLVQLYLGGLHARVITKSHFGHLSERAAERNGDAGQVNWPALNQLSARFQRHIKKLTLAKASGRSVLIDAYAKFQAGYTLKETAGSPNVYAAVAV